MIGSHWDGLFMAAALATRHGTSTAHAGTTRVPHHSIAHNSTAKHSTAHIPLQGPAPRVSSNGCLCLCSEPTSSPLLAPTPQASYHDCFRMFNPLTKEGMTDVYRKWLPAIYKMLELLPSHPQVAGQVAGIGAASQAAAAAGGGASAVGRVPHNVALTSSVGPNSSRPVAAAAPVGGAQPAAQALLLAQQPVAAAGRHALITPLLRAWASWLAGVAGMAVVVTVVLGYVRPGLLPRQARMLHKLAQTGSSSAAI